MKIRPLLLVSVRSLTFLAMMVSLPVLGSQVATLTQINGSVQIFSNPGKSPAKVPSPRVKFKKTFYTYRMAQIGDRVGKGNILRTSLGSKAKVVYDNGDQFSVGPGSAYKITWDKAGKNPEMNLMYGKIRGVVSKKGLRNRLRIRTKGATMGVRGTDFFVTHSKIDTKTEVAVMRGEVKVRSAKASKAVAVKKGYSAVVRTRPAPQAKQQKAKPMKPIVMQKTAKQELQAIQNLTTVKRVERAPASNMSDKDAQAMKEKIEKLEKKAVETVMEDVKEYNPEQYKRLASRGPASVEAVSELVMQDLMETAPEAPADKKPFSLELESLQDSAYRKYFDE